MFFWYLGYLISCWLIADFICGIYHFLIDRYDLSKIPYIGETFYKHITGPNDAHHDYPRLFLEGGFWGINAVNFIWAFGVGFIVFLFSPICSTPFFMAAFGNQMHAYAHRKGKVSRVVSILQEMGLIQSPKHHSVHHKAPFDCYFCPMTNYLNPILEYTKFWVMVEWVIYKVFKIRSTSPR